MRINILLLTVLFFLPKEIMAQNGNTIIGSVYDKTTKEKLPSATVALSLISTPDKKRYTTTDINGSFTFDKLANGTYTITISYVGYKSSSKNIKVSDNKNYNISLALVENSMMLGEVSAKGRATRAEQKGDTLVYNAEAFKVMDGSSAEELISKMPGIVVEGGSIQAQGEDVKKVLVDGKEFFDGDVNLALKNIPSDVISNIEIFDKKSEQAEFTGFDDGEQIKTLNITTKNGFRKGTFGEVSAGYGSEDRYKVNGNINFFNNNQRLSILGMSNNVNQQNFSQEDLAGVMSSTQGQRRGTGGKGNGGPRGGMMRSGGSFGSGPSSMGAPQASNFMVGSLGGVTNTDGLGVNYVQKINNKLDFMGSYFFNNSSNTLNQTTDREYFESVLPGLSYKEFSESKMDNYNHRVNMKFDYKIDDNNSIMIRPTFSYQNNDSKSYLNGKSLTNDLENSNTENSNNTNTDSYRLGTELVFRHKFPVEGRTLSLMFNGNLSNTSGDTYSDYINQIFDKEVKKEEYSLYKDTENKQYSLRGNMMFTEKIWDNLQLQLDYKASYSNTDADRKTYNQSPLTDLFDQLDESLSNVYSSDYLTQAAGIGLRFREGKFSAMISTDLQWANLQGDETYPLKDIIKNNYFSVLPSAMARYAIDRNNAFMFRYNSYSSSPSISDLQNVIDNSNPLFLSSGNPELNQQINHSANLRYIKTTQSGKTFIAMIGATVRTNYVADSTYIAKEDTELTPNITLNKGAQFSRPINMNGYYSLQSMLTYGMPVDFIKSNVNFSVSANYSRIPTIFNGEKSKTSEINVIPKVIIGSNISKNLDFTLSYSAAINNAFNSLSGSEESNYIYHTAGAKFGWNIWNNFIFRSTFTYNNYTGLGEDNSDYYLWNASIGKKILKNNAAEIKLEAFDIIKQNESFNRTVGSNYYDYTDTNVLKPYVMLSFVYTIR